MKTIENWLYVLPDVYRELALAAAKKQGGKHIKYIKTSSLTGALNIAFRWSFTDEGSEFWNALTDECDFYNL
jgi:hypothetical protein